MASWVEFTLLRRTLNRRIGPTGIPQSYLLRLWVSALAAAALGWTIRHFSGHHSPIPLAAIVLVPYGVVYFGMAMLLGVSEARSLLARFMPR